MDPQTPPFGSSMPPPMAGGPPPPQQGTKDWLTTVLLCFFLGGLGVHRFYTGHTKTGILMLITLGGCGIWSIYDLIMILTGAFKDSEGLPLLRK